MKGKVAIVAGAAPGNIGAATAVRLAEEEAGRRGGRSERVRRSSGRRRDPRSWDGRAAARSFDISDEASYKELIDFTIKEFGRLDGLFNVAADLSAATVARDSDVISVPLDVWQHTIDVTLTGYMYGIRHALPIMIGQGSGSIVNTMSTSVWMGEEVHVAYQSAKAGLVWAHAPHRLARRQAWRAMQFGCAGGDTHRSRARKDNGRVSQRDARVGAVASPRSPRDLAAMVAFLFSDDGAYVNGQTILVDGGANLT